MNYVRKLSISDVQAGILSQDLEKTICRRYATQCGSKPDVARVAAACIDATELEFYFLESFFPERMSRKTLSACRGCRHGAPLIALFQERCVTLLEIVGDFFIGPVFFDPPPAPLPQQPLLGRRHLQNARNGFRK